jgi:hypothetical protein
MNPINSDSKTRSHLKNHLIFYAVAVLTVLGLFQLTSAYGEAHLTAPPNLNGDYLSATAPPGCPANSRLRIAIQQSGIFLNGAVELAQTEALDPIQATALTLTGHWRQQLELTGKAPTLESCGLADGGHQVHLTAAFQPASSSPASLVGQLNLGNSQSWSFTAIQQTAAAQQKSH